MYQIVCSLHNGTFHLYLHVYLRLVGAGGFVLGGFVLTGADVTGALDDGGFVGAGACVVWGLVGPFMVDEANGVGGTFIVVPCTKW